MIGQVFGKLTVIEEVEPKIYAGKARNFKMRMFRCACACGSTTVSRRNGLLYEGIKSCGCARWSEMSTNPIGRKEPGLAYLNYMFRYYKANAIKKDRVFDLTPEQFRSIVVQACEYCGVPPAPGSNLKSKRLKNVFHGTMARNGLDRRDSSHGYTVENCVACCRPCNIAKHTFSEIEFKTWVNRVHAHWASKT